jgi:hypothetical protein
MTRLASKVGWMAVVLAVAPWTMALAADPEVTLLRIVTARDEVVVGVTGPEIERMGRGVPLEVFSAQLQAMGQLPVWQYASQRAANGELVMSLLRRISVFAAGTSRIEPYATPLKIVPPG